MNIPSDTHKRMMSAYQLLQQDRLSISTFEHIRTIVKGIHPVLDEKLEHCSRALDKLQKIQSGDVITLSTEALPENTEEEKKRKKLLLFFINSLKDVKSEIQRIDAEFTKANKNGHSAQNQMKSWGRIIGFAKGPFGIVTLIALLIVGFSLFRGQRTKNNTANITISPTVVSNNTTKVQVIVVNGKQIPLTQLFVGHGPDCDSPHYHALNDIAAKALDGTVLQDPGGCGFGKVKDVQVVEIAVTISPSP